MTHRRFRLPSPPKPAASPDAFVLVPLAGLPDQSREQAACQRALYEWAYREAQAVVQPALPERDLLGVWN